MTISAKIIADSINEYGNRITTLQLRYPRFIHAEFMTHRVFSRNASSSRAIPVKRLIQDIIDDPVYPSYWGANQKGMQAGEEINTKVKLQTIQWRSIIPWLDYDEDDLRPREEVWDIARNNAINIAKVFDEAGYHKQIVNRLLEPFSHINVVVTATEWNNFFALRCHKDAQPEMRMLAEAILAAMNASSPTLLKPGEWHLPYVTERDSSHWLLGLKSPELINSLIKLSVARCARVSYLTHDGKEPDIDSDLELFDRLVGSAPLHASPAEHQATPDERYTQVLKPTQFDIGEATIEKWRQPNLHGNFTGWIQYRKTLPNENQS